MLHVNVANGEVCHSKIDFSLPGFIRMEFERSYKSLSDLNGAFGWNWNHPLDSFLAIGEASFTYRDPSATQIELKPAENTDEQSAASADGAPELLAGSDDGDYLIYEHGTFFVLHHLSAMRKIFFPMDGPHPATALKPVRIEDLNGNAFIFSYNEFGMLERLRDTLGRTILVSHNERGKITEFKLSLENPKRLIGLARYAYDEYDNLVMVSDAAGNPTRYLYHDHLIVQCSNKLGGVYYARYDDRRRCLDVWGEGGYKRRRVGYDDNTRTTRVTNALGQTTVYRSNEAGLVVDEVDPLGNVKTSLYDPSNGLLAALDEQGKTKTTTAYDPTTRTLTVIDAVGAASIFTDNERGQVTSKIDAAGGRWSWSYDEFGNVTRIVHPSGVESAFAYDGRGFLATLENPSGNVIRQELSEDGRQFSVRDELGPLMAYEYDEMGYMISAVDGNGARHAMVRNARGQIIERRWPDGSSIRYEYDAEGNLTKQINEIGNETSLEYDAYGQCLRVIGPLGDVVSYQYDLEGNPVAVVNELGELHRFSYDALERVVGQIFFDGTEERYRYDELGNIVEIIDGEGRSTFVSYNEVNLMTEKRYPDGRVERFSYDGLRRLTEAENDAATVRFEWDESGNMIAETQGDTVLNYLYDTAGNLLELADSKGRKIKYEYDLRGRITAIKDNAAGRHRFAYDPAGLPVKHRLPNGVELHTEYDRRNRFARQSVTVNAAVLLDKSYQFDAADRLLETAFTYALKDVPKRTVKKYFEYDELERITNVRTPSGRLEEYVYDATGNVVYSSELGQLSYRRGNLLEQTPFGSCRHDRCGALSQLAEERGEATYRYDGAGRLAAVAASDGTEVKFAYDALGRRVMKRRNGTVTKYAWRGFALLEEITRDTSGENNGERTTQYLFDERTLTPLSRVCNGEAEHFLSDRRGCVIAAMSNRGDITGVFDYSAFGRLRGSQDYHPFRLRGQHYDAETGLHYNFHRYYNPQVGRFLNRDPLGIDAGRNLYRFGPNPVTWEDPFGLTACQGDVFYRAMSEKEKNRVMKDCKLKAKDSKCPEGPYVTENKSYCDAAMSEKPDKYEHLVEICTKPGTVASMTSSPFACRNGSQAQFFPNLPDVVSGNPNRIEHKMERGGLNYGLSKGKGLDHFNSKVESMKVVGTGETCKN